jgi:Ca2+-binding RTX toxin-like protein
MANITGTAGNDVLNGTPSDDTIFGLNGNDTINGGAGIDNLYGGLGDDRLFGGDGNDVLIGYATSPTEPGNEYLDGGPGDDRLFGSGGNNTLIGGDGNDQLYGSIGSDSLDGGVGNDMLYGDAGNDTLLGGAGDDVLDGGMGNDTLVGGTGSDRLTGGAGNDTLYAYQISPTEAGNDYLDGGDGDDVLYSSGGNNTLLGGRGNDMLYGGNGNDVLDGGAGDDTLSGGNGNDTLIGGGGYDNLDGGAGEDTYVISSRNFSLSDSSGNDTAIVSTSFVKVPSFIENVRYENGAQALPYWIDALLMDRAASFSTILGPSKTFSYTYPSALPSYDLSSADALQYLPFNEAQKTFSRAALAYVQSVVDLRFFETTVSAAPNTITFNNNAQTGSAGYAYGPTSSGFVSNDLFLSRNDPGNLAPRDGTYAPLVLIHELGHVFGLKHPFSQPDSTGRAGVGPYLPVAEDKTSLTVLSYTSNPAQYRLAYSDFDIAALQYLYGPSQTARTGNDRYTVSAATSNFIWDGAGIDTLDASAQSQAATLYLEPGYWGFIGARSSLISAPGQVTVNFGSVIENLAGGSGNDTLFGNAASNSISGGAGNDRITGGGGNDSVDGGAGIDTASYAGLRANYTVYRSGGGFTVTDRAGAEGTDTLIQVERLQFADTTLALDSSGNGGQVYRVYQAAFNRRPDLSGLGFWINSRDAGTSLQTIANGFVQSAEFRALYGNSPSNLDYVNRLYDNVLHRPGEAGGVNFWLGTLNSRAASMADVLASFSESAENQAALIGLIQDGFTYTPYG